MDNSLKYILDKIKDNNLIHYKKLNKNLMKVNADYFKRAELFLSKYQHILADNNLNLDYAIDSYLKMIASFNYETIRFIETGKYSNTSFEDVNKNVYNNPEVMEYHMHGLLLSQFLWTHHYKILTYFNKVLQKYNGKINNYLEIGGGHGLYVCEAMQIIENLSSIDLVDISKTSIEMAEKMIGNDKVNYILTNIFDYNPDKKYDFITMGEVLEHVEEPIELLKKVASLLSENGVLFITTPTNAPSIDHIYLFKNADEIREVIDKANLEVISEISHYSEDVTEEIAERFKITMMYGATLLSK